VDGIIDGKGKLLWHSCVPTYQEQISAARADGCPAAHALPAVRLLRPWRGRHGDCQGARYSEFLRHWKGRQRLFLGRLHRAGHREQFREGNRDQGAVRRLRQQRNSRDEAV